MCKVNSRWIASLKVKGKTVSFLKENTGKYHYDLEVGKDVLNKIQ